MEENKVTLCWPNYVNKSVISGGGWRAEMPLDHLKSGVLAEVARSVDTTLANTKFSVTLFRSEAVRSIALANHNLSASAKWKVKVFSSSNDLLYSSGWGDVWPAVYTTPELQWEDDNFWLGTINQDDMESFTSLTTHFPTINVGNRVDIEVDDQSNPVGYVKIGRVFVGDAWQPEHNASYGIQYGYETNTSFNTSDNPQATEYADVKVPKRNVNFSLELLNEGEGFNSMLKMQRVQGLHGEVLFTQGAVNSPQTFARTFLARQESVDPLSNPYFDSYETSVNLKEIL